MPFTDVSTVAGWEDFGFRYHEGNNNVGWDDAHGVLSFRYTEPMTWWMSMDPALPRTLAEACAGAGRARGGAVGFGATDGGGVADGGDVGCRRPAGAVVPERAVGERGGVESQSESPAPGHAERGDDCVERRLPDEHVRGRGASAIGRRVPGFAGGLRDGGPQPSAGSFPAHDRPPDVHDGHAASGPVQGAGGLRVHAVDQRGRAPPGRVDVRQREPRTGSASFVRGSTCSGPRPTG